MAKNRAEDTAAINLENNQATEGGNNQMKIMGIIGLVVFLLAAFFIYKIMYKEPRAKEAMENITQAQMQFERDSFQLALNNPGNDMPGFLDIIEDYSGTPTANTSRFYAGVSYLQLKKYDLAIEYLSKFDSDDELLGPTALGAIGDAFADIDQQSVQFDGQDYHFSELELLQKLELLIGLAAAKRCSIGLFSALLVDCQMSWVELYQQYVSKNVLNFFVL